MMRYDLGLFLKLNDEWANKPVVPSPRNAKDPKHLVRQSFQRIQWLLKFLELQEKRVLEIGCGRGYLVRALNDQFGCKAEGIDIVQYSEWQGDGMFHKADIAESIDIGKFDIIISFAVWEHIRHPFSALLNQRKMLKKDGVVYLYANLFTGPKASHCYREIFFPWPHLLFCDDVFMDFYEHIGKKPRGASWVNRFNYAHYLNSFEKAGYDIRKAWPSKPWWDENFYIRFEDMLGRYSQWDLKHDFIHAILVAG